MPRGVSWESGAEYRAAAGGSPTRMGGAMMPGLLGGNDPFSVQRKMAENAGSAWDIASQMMAPGQRYQPGGGTDFSGAAQALQSRVTDTPHPGMGNAEFEEALKQIRMQGQTQRTGLSNTMAGFGGSLDPEAYMRASQAVGGQEMGARAGLVAKRAGLDRETLMGATQALSPYFRGQQAQFSELAGLAGNVMGGGVYNMGRSPYGTGVPGDTRPQMTGGF